MVGAALPLLASSTSVNQLPRLSLNSPSSDPAFSSPSTATQSDPMFSCASSLVIAAPSLCGGDTGFASLPGTLTATFQLQTSQQSTNAETSTGVLSQPALPDTRSGFDVILITVATMTVTQETLQQQQNSYVPPSNLFSTNNQVAAAPTLSASQMTQSFVGALVNISSPPPEPAPSPAPMQQAVNSEVLQAVIAGQQLPELTSTTQQVQQVVFPTMNSYTAQVNTVPQFNLQTNLSLANIVSLTQPDAYSFVVADVPEPSTVFLAAAGLALLALKRRRA